MSEKPQILSVQRPAKPEPDAAEPAVPTAKLKKTITVKPGGKKQARLSKDSEPQQGNQSVGIFTGRLHLDGEKLHLLCPDGAALPIVAIDSKLSLWLLSHPAELFSPEDRLWLVYPKCDWRSGDLQVHLKARLAEDHNFNLEPDIAHIKGKLLEVEGNKLTVAIRRNIPADCYKTLQKRGIISPGSDLAQFKVVLWGLTEAEPKSVVEFKVQRNGNQLLL